MENTSEETPVLIAQSGPLNGQRWMIRTGLVIGRDNSCDVVVPDRQVSRQHARVVVSREGVSLEDLGSKNGTHHNGSRITGNRFLQDGDSIKIALAQEFTFVSADATMPLGSKGQPSSKPTQPKLRLMKHSRQVWIGDKEIDPPLSVAQFSLLEMLYTNETRVVSRKSLAVSVWGAEVAPEVSEQALDALIRRLRDRLAEIDPNHNYLVTVRGHGLRIDNPLE